MTKPVRLQLSRRKGFDLQAHSRAVNGLPAVYVGRPTKFGNPFRVGRDGTPDQCVSLYRRGILAARAAWLGGPDSIFSPQNDEIYRAWEARAPHLQYTGIELSLRDLRGKNLGCWCKPSEPCHADVLLELANAEART